MDDVDALIGLRFEVGGGLSRMTGRVLGKAGGLYLVQKTDSPYCELLQLDDLRSAKFFIDEVDTAVTAPATTTSVPSPPASADLSPPAPIAESPPGRRRLADQLRRNLGRSDPTA